MAMVDVAPAWEAAQTSNDVYQNMVPLMAEVDSSERQVELAGLGVVDAPLVRLSVPGPHDVWVLDETAQPGENFKYTGAANAVLAVRANTPRVSRVSLGSAGNWGASATIAAAKVGLETTAHVPEDIVAEKELLLRRYGAAVVKHATLKQAVEAAEESADARTAFLHPYNNPHSVGALSLVGERLLRRAVEGGVDLRSKRRTVVAIQGGGGSLLMGVAARIRQGRENGSVGDNLEVRLTQPYQCDTLHQTSQGLTNPYPGGKRMDKRYGGLAVENPSRQAALMVADPEFVQGFRHVSEADSGRAANYLARALGGKRIEAAGLAGLAAYFAEADSYTEPTTFLAIATGANTSAAAYHDFSVGALRREQEYATRASGPKLGDLFQAQPFAGRAPSQVANGRHLRKSVV